MLGLLQVKETTGQVTLGSGFRWHDYVFNHIRIAERVEREIL